MENDFNDEVPISEDTTDENANVQDCSFFDLQLKLFSEKQQRLELKLEESKRELELRRKQIKYLEDSLMDHELSQFQNLHSEYAETRIVSPIHEAQNLSQDRYENFPDSTTLADTLWQSDNASQDPIESLRKQSKDFSNDLASFELLVEGEIRKILSPPKSWDDEAQAALSYTESNTGFKTTSDFPIRFMETDIESGNNFGGKGKEAANPKYRYKKISKTDVSCEESLTNDSSVKLSEEVFVIPKLKTLDSHSPKGEITGIFRAGKRKSDESFARTSVITKLSGNRSEDGDGVIITKKPKLEAEKLSIQYLESTEFSQKNFERIDSAEFMEQPRTDQSLNESEHLILPSSSGLSKGEDSSLTSGGENVLSANQESSLTHTSQSNVSLSGREESSLTSVSNVSLSEREESSLTSLSNMSLSANDES